MAVADGVSVTDRERARVLVCFGVPVSEGEADGVSVADRERVRVLVCDGVPVVEGEVDGAPERDDAGVVVADGVLVCDCEAPRNGTPRCSNGSVKSVGRISASGNSNVKAQTTAARAEIMRK